MRAPSETRTALDVDLLIEELAQTDAKYYRSSWFHKAGDLYLEATPEVNAIVARYEELYDNPLLSVFCDNITGKRTYDFAFLYERFIAAKTRINGGE